MAKLATRKSLSKKARFEVFKRDSFTCQYCGATPPKVVLEIDHIDPVANGGGNNIENLITACFDCNMGKSKTLLSSTEPPLADHFDKVSEKEEQIKAHKKLLTQIKRRKTREENKVATIFAKKFEGTTLTTHFKKGSLRKFLDMLAYHDVEGAMEKACDRFSDPTDNNYDKKEHPSKAVKYFCGICWNMVRDNE